MASNLLEFFRDYLVAQGLCRKPSVYGSAYPMFLEPEIDRAIIPGDFADSQNDDKLIFSVFYNGGPAPRTMEGEWLRDMVLDLWYVTSDPPYAYTIEKSIRTALIDKFAWSMAGLTVNYSGLSTEFQRIGNFEGFYRFKQGWLFNLAAPGP